MSFKIIMTTSVIRSCFTTQHQTCKTKTKTDFLVWDRSCPKTDGLRPHHWSRCPTMVCYVQKNGYLLTYLLTIREKFRTDSVSTRISNLRLNISACGSSTSLDTLVVTTICGDACPLSCVSAEACFTGWPNAQHIGGLRSSIPIGGWRMMDRPVSATHARGTYDENSFSYPRRIR